MVRWTMPMPRGDGREMALLGYYTGTTGIDGWDAAKFDNGGAKGAVVLLPAASRLKRLEINFVHGKIQTRGSLHNTRRYLE